MKDIIAELNKAFDHRVRLGIMSILLVNDWMEFNAFKALLEVTDGNLASHIKSLEKEEYIEVKKQFVGKKPNTTYRVTEKGRKSFEAHLDALEKLLNIRP
jgi:DNA-binding MarR family transcriptional regulator